MRKKKRPKISIAKIVQRGNDLAMICRRDKQELIKAGIEWNIVQRVAELVPLCSDADSLYQLQKESLCIATKEHLEYLKECSKLRGELRAEINTSLELCGFRKKLPGLSKKRSKTDLVQDLNDLAVISRNNHQNLEKVNFDFALAQRAAHLSKELSEAIANLDLQRESLHGEEVTRRNTVYDELYAIINEICTFGRRAFSTDPSRRKFYHRIY